MTAGGLSRAEYRALLRRDFAAFAERAFYEINGRADFAANWHLEVLAAKLAAVRAGRIRRLVVNLPPRHLKSLLASVAFPAWCLGHDPAARLLCVSYAQDLADQFARDCRRVMTSGWYRGLFATRLSPVKTATQEFVTTAQGCRLAVGVGGALTGRGADIIILDDPLKPEEALSRALRQAVNEWYDHTLYSRLNDKRKSAIVLVMHRLHEDDLTAHVLAQEDWQVVRLPAIAEWEEHHTAAVSSSGRGFAIMAPTRCRPVSSASCRAGTPPTRRANSATTAYARAGALPARICICSTCCAGASNTPS